MGKLRWKYGGKNALARSLATRSYLVKLIYFDKFQIYFICPGILRWWSLAQITEYDFLLYRKGVFIESIVFYIYDLKIRICWFFIFIFFW